MIGLFDIGGTYANIRVSKDDILKEYKLNID